MIHIEKKELCCGCSACVQKCPRKCISLRQDDEGFWYPHVDAQNCVNCGLCERACPFIGENASREPLKCFAAYNANENERLNSSSGGIFSLFARYVLDRKGVVFGAAFDDSFVVKHIYIESESELYKLRGSKYVQSDINGMYAVAESFLKDDRMVLFSGTPCQIRGLQKFLGKDYKKLMSIDVACHGVPSPLLWQMYLKDIRKNVCRDIGNIKFKDKTLGWRKSRFSVFKPESETPVYSTVFNTSAWGQSFVSNLMLRPSCHFCKVKKFSSGSDITIADFWGCEKKTPLLDDNKGLSAVMVHSEKGGALCDNMNVVSIPINSEDIVEGNGALQEPFSPSSQRSVFFSEIKKGMSFEIASKKCVGLSLKGKVKAVIKKSIFFYLAKKSKSGLNGLLKYLDRFLANCGAILIKSDCKIKKILLIPADSIVGGFGEDIMVDGFLNGSDCPVTIVAPIIESRAYLNGRKHQIQCVNGLVGKFPLLSMFRLLRKHSDLYVIGADILDGVYANNKIRFDIVKIAKRMRVDAHVTGFSVREKPSKYFCKQIKKCSLYMPIKIRDVDSYGRMRRVLPEDRLVQTVDIAFLSKERPSYEVAPEIREWVSLERSKGKKIAAFCPNTIQAKKRGLKKYLEEQIALLNGFKSLNCSILFLYHDLRKYALGINDKELSKMISYYFEDCGLFCDHVGDGCEVKSYIKMADFTISGRMHFGISGYALGVPMYGISYFNKFEGLQKMFDVNPDESLVNADALASLPPNITTFCNNLTKYKASVERNVSDVIKEAYRNY